MRPSPSGTAHLPGPRAVIAHPSSELYGSDRQLLETVSALVGAGWAVDTYLPVDGPLARELHDRGSVVRIGQFPVLRKSALRPLPFAQLTVAMVRSTLRARRLLRRDRPTLVLVNTVTVPSWLAAARLAGVPTVCHVHEAEDGQSTVVRTLLVAPLLLAQTVVANSQAAADVVARGVPRLRRRTVVVHNGVPSPTSPLRPLRERAPGAPVELALVGRLSPRKGIDVALEATAELVARGYDVHLSVCGTPFTGYEWFEAELTERAARPDLAGRVDLLGYVHPTWAILDRADIALVPSRVEPFGNTAVEAMLAGRPLVASRTQGLREVVRDGQTGVLVEPGDPHALSLAIEGLINDPERARTLARGGFDDASQRFSSSTYRRAILAAITVRAAEG